MRSALRTPSLVVLLALLLGIVADRLFTGRSIGVSAPLFVGAGLVALGWLSRAEGRPPERANLWLGVVALLMAGFLASRVAPELVVLNCGAALGSLLLLVAHYRGPALFRLSAFQLIGRSLGAFWAVVAAPPLPLGTALRAAPIRRTQIGAALPVARGLVLAVPAMLGFGGLLVSADTVFASYVSDTFSFRLPFSPLSVVNHTLVTLVVAWACAGGLVVALSSYSPARVELPAEGDTQRLYPQRTAWPALGWVEALTVLVLVDLLFGAFMLVQGAYFFGGMDTLDRTGMTYAMYARRGFFELFNVAWLSLTLLGSLALVTRRPTPPQRLLFNAASSGMVMLVLGMLLSAFGRMMLYEQAYGFTRQRVYTHSFMVWLAVVLLLFLAALLLNRARVFVFGSLVAALLYVFGLNIINPDATIARANIARYDRSGRLDATYLASLSADATPDLVAALDRLDPASRALLRARLDRQRLALSETLAQDGWPSWNLARARALAALDTLPVPETE